MKITEVKVRIREKEDSKMRGIATVKIDDCFVVHDIRILEGENGLFIAMPSKKTPAGEYRDVAHPIDKETRALFEDAVLSEYKNALENAAEDTEETEAVEEE